MYLLLAGLALVFLALLLALGANEAGLSRAVERTSEYTNQMMAYDRLCQSAEGDERDRWRARRDEFRAQWEDDPHFEQNSGLKRRKNG